jgi:hypothetical protein
LGEPWIRHSNIWSWVPQDLDPRMNALARASSTCKRPLIREDAPRQHTCSCLQATKIWSWVPDGAWRQDRLAEWSSVVTQLWLLVSLLEEYEVGVRWPPACEDVSPGAKERPLLEAVTKQRSEDRD